MGWDVADFLYEAGNLKHLPLGRGGGGGKLLFGATKYTRDHQGHSPTASILNSPRLDKILPSLWDWEGQLAVGVENSTPWVRTLALPLMSCVALAEAI